MSDKFTFSSAGEAQEVEFALARNGWSHQQLKQATGGDFFGLVREVLEGRAEICRIERLTVGNTSSEPSPEPILDFVVRVDRSVKPNYPDWMEKLMRPELELAGPAEYDLSKVDQWLCDDQKRGSVVGKAIYKHLLNGGALATCLNLQDGLAIQQKGIAVFRKLFAGKTVFLWGSVVRDRDGDLDVPCLCEYGGRVVVHWHWLVSHWYSNHPALRFSK